MISRWFFCTNTNVSVDCMPILLWNKSLTNPNESYSVMIQMKQIVKIIKKENGKHKKSS